MQEYDGKRYASLPDAQGAIRAILEPEQWQAVAVGATIEIVVDVKPLGDEITEADRDTIAKGVNAFSAQFPGLTLGCFYDISLRMRVGGGEWQPLTTLNEPIDVAIDIPDEIYQKGAVYHIIRAHDGNYLLLEDRDDNDRTITISSQLFSTYAISYQAGAGACPLCGVCAQPLGVCVWVWILLFIIVCAIILVLYLRRRSKRKQEDRRPIAT